MGGNKNPGRESRTITTMRLPDLLLKKLTKKAARDGVSRTRYLENLARRDVGMPLIEEPAAAPAPSTEAPEMEGGDGIFS